MSDIDFNNVHYSAFWFAAVGVSLRAIASRLAQLGALAAIGRALKWFFTGSLLELVGKRIVVWFALMAVGGPLVKAFKIASMMFVYYLLLRIVGLVGIDALVDGFVAWLNILPPQTICALKLLGFNDCFRLLVSTGATVGTIRILLRLAG